MQMIFSSVSMSTIVFVASFVYVSGENFGDRVPSMCEDLDDYLHVSSNGRYRVCMEVVDDCNADLGNGDAVKDFCRVSCDNCHPHPSQSPLTFAPSSQLTDQNVVSHPSLSPIIHTPHKFPSVTPSMSPSIDSTQRPSDFGSLPTFFSSPDVSTEMGRNISFRGNYRIVIEGHEEEFFEECNEHLNPVRCVNIYSETNPVSIIVTFRGEEEDLKLLVGNIVSEGLILDHFSTFTVTPEFAAKESSMLNRQKNVQDTEDSNESVGVLVAVILIGVVVFVAAIMCCIYRAFQFQKQKDITENMNFQIQTDREGKNEIAKPAQYQSDIENTRRRRNLNSVWDKTPGLTHGDDSNILSFDEHQARTCSSIETPLQLYANSRSEGDKTRNMGNDSGIAITPSSSINAGWVSSPEFQEPHRAVRGTAPYCFPQPNMHSSPEFVYSIGEFSEGPKENTTTVNCEIQF